MTVHMRLARPVSDLALSVAAYQRGLGLQELGRFENHEGFDGVMLGQPGSDVHFEFTVCRSHPVRPTPTPEDLWVFYQPDATVWQATCDALLRAEFGEVVSFNPYWGRHGRTFEDRDGYRVVIQRAAWVVLGQGDV